jgi:hypothetical protein
MYDYVKKHYAVNPIVGNRVRLLEGKEQPEGTIAREDKSMGHYVMVRFEGVRWPAPCHPTSLEYLGPAAK